MHSTKNSHAPAADDRRHSLRAATQLAAITLMCLAASVPVVCAGGASASKAGNGATPKPTAITFTDIGAGLPGSYETGSSWGDFDGDGFLDILLTGPVTSLYQGNGTGSFTFHDTGILPSGSLPGLGEPAVAWGDYDNDGKLDVVVLCASDCSVYHNNGNGTFTAHFLGITNITNGSVAWGDYDNDGYLDLAMSGTHHAGIMGSIVTAVYHNNHDNTFTDINAGLLPATEGALAWGDYDNDGHLDLVISGSQGQSSLPPATRLYHNEGNGTFTQHDPGLPGNIEASLAWGDYDNDGRLDLLVSGTSYGITADGAFVFHNDGNGSFSDINAGLANLSTGSAVWGDYDNDGLLDILVTGTDNNTLAQLAIVYHNDGGGVFTDANAGLTGVEEGWATWGDYDNDGDLDILLTGFTADAAGTEITKIYRNDGATPNTPPQAPGGLSASMVGNVATFSWVPSTDAETPTSGLSYNLRVGTTPLGQEAMTGMMNTTSGFREVVALGNAQENTSWSVTLQPASAYYWCVQAIDGAFAGSVCSAEQVLLPSGSTVAGTKFRDLNGNGVKDAGEPGLPGWLITETGPVSGSTLTASGGTYSFGNLPPGAYSVSEVNQAGWSQTDPAAGSYSTTLAVGQSAQNLDFGNCLLDPCYGPPGGMVAWWPLDEGAGTVHDIAGTSHGSRVGSPTFVAGKVMGALRFPTSSDYVEVPDKPALHFGTGNFSVDAWVNINATSAGTRTIVDKLPYHPGIPVLGFQLFLSGDVPAFTLACNGAQQSFTSTAPAFAPGTWHHVVATVNRTVNLMAFAVDGVNRGVFSITVTGSVTNNGTLRIGQSHDPSSPAMNGIIDEVELFNRALSFPEVVSIFSAGSAGKCRRGCFVPRVATFAKNQTSAGSCFEICNSDWSVPSHTYTWLLKGLPASPPSCLVNGPTTFTPSSGQVTVAAGSCTWVCVNVQRPAGLTPGKTACYSLTITDQTTGTCRTCTGTLRALTKWHFGDPFANASVQVPSGLATPVHFRVAAEDSAVSFGYQILAVPESESDDIDSTSLWVSLNGLPPGTPVTGTLSLAAGDSADVVVNASFPVGDIMIPTQEVLFLADEDNDGTMSPLAVVPVSPEDGSVTSTPPPPGSRVSRFLGASPNPFLERTVLRFLLAESGAPRLSIFDVSGRLVRSFSPTGAAGIPVEVVWDGRDARGRNVPAGLYFVHVVAGGPALNWRVVKVH